MFISRKAGKRAEIVLVCFAALAALAKGLAVEEIIKLFEPTGAGPR
jgi:hypothetical protein